MSEKNLGITGTADFSDIESALTRFIDMVNDIVDKVVNIDININDAGLTEMAGELNQLDSETITPEINLEDNAALQDVNTISNELITIDSYTASPEILLFDNDINARLIDATNELSEIDSFTASPEINTDAMLTGLDEVKGDLNEVGTVGNEAGEEIAEGFDYALIAVAALTGGTFELSQQMLDLQTELTLLSTYTGQDQSELKDTVAYISNASFPQDAAMDYMMLLEQMGSDSSKLAENAQALNKIVRGTGSEDKVGMDFAKAVKVLGGDVNDLAKYYGMAGYAQKNVIGGLEGFASFATVLGPKLKAMGFNAEESAVIIGALSYKYGGKIRGMRSEITAADGDATKLMKSLGMTRGEVDNSVNSMDNYAGSVEAVSTAHERNQGVMNQSGAIYDDLKLKMGEYGAFALEVLGVMAAGFIGIPKILDTLGKKFGGSAVDIANWYRNLISYPLNFATTIKDSIKSWMGWGDDAGKAGANIGSRLTGEIKDTSVLNKIKSFGSNVLTQIRGWMGWGDEAAKATINLSKNAGGRFEMDTSFLQKLDGFINGVKTKLGNLKNIFTSGSYFKDEKGRMPLTDFIKLEDILESSYKAIDAVDKYLAKPFINAVNATYSKIANVVSRGIGIIPNAFKGAFNFAFGPMIQEFKMESLILEAEDAGREFTRVMEVNGKFVKDSGNKWIKSFDFLKEDKGMLNPGFVDDFANDITIRMPKIGSAMANLKNTIVGGIKSIKIPSLPALDGIVAPLSKIAGKIAIPVTIALGVLEAFWHGADLYNQNIVTAFLDLLGIDDIMKAIGMGEGWENFKNWINGYIGTIRDFTNFIYGIKIGDMLNQFLTDMQNVMQTSLDFSSVGAFFSSFADVIVTPFRDIYNEGPIQWIQRIFGRMVELLTPWGQAIWERLSWIGTVVWNGMVGIGQWFYVGIASIIPVVYNGLVGIWNQFINFNNWLLSIPGAVYRIMLGFGQHMYLGIMDDVNLVKQGLLNIWNQFMNFLDDIRTLPIRMYHAGGEMIDGLIKGIKEKVPELGGVLEWIKGFFPQSPPKWGPLVDIMDWGGNMADAIGGGLEREFPAVISNFANQLGSLRGILNTPLTGNLSGFALPAASMNAMQSNTANPPNVVAYVTIENLGNISTAEAKEKGQIIGNAAVEEISKNLNQQMTDNGISTENSIR